MTAGSRVRIVEWSAWAPGLSTPNAWIQFFRTGKRSRQADAPNVSRVPPLLRRRMSLLTRMVVTAGMDCCRRAAIPASDVPVVFTSRHGEMGVTIKLLDQGVRREALSPMHFSGSVHHTPLGYFSLATGNRQATHAVAGVEASFGCGFLDALGLLSERETSPILLITADERLAAPFSGLVGKANMSYAVAFLLERSQFFGKDSVELELPSRPGLKARRMRLGGVPALEFLRWFLDKNERRPLEGVASGRLWRWKK